MPPIDVGATSAFLASVRWCAELPFLRINPSWGPDGDRGDRRDQSASLSWALAHDLIARARIGCVPGADFGDNGEGYIRFCFARDRRELAGALESLGKYLVERSSSLT